MSETDSKRLVVQLPMSLFSKLEEAARRDFSSVSDTTRRVLASDLRVRGLLAEDEGEVIA
jgi:metal-responsive CopG/Arc/MetJ family transcriptional regulator